MKQLLIVSLITLISISVSAQSRFEDLKIKLESASAKQPGLLEVVNLSVNHYTIHEIIRAIAVENKLNLSVDSRIKATPSYNFSNAKAMDVFLLICKEHNLTMEWTGEIISFLPYEAAPLPEIVTPQKEIKLSYKIADSTITADLNNDTLFSVIQKLSKQSGINVDLGSSLKNNLVSMTIINQKPEEVLERLADGNEVQKLSENYFRIRTAIPPQKEFENLKKSRSAQRNTSRTSNRQINTKGNYTVVVGKDSLITIDAINCELKDLIEEVCNQSSVNFFLFDEPKGALTLKTEKLSFEESLTFLLNTSDFTYRKIDSVYIIGDRKKEMFRQTETYQFQYRAIDGIADIIPSDMKKNIEIKESIELNSFILSGSLPEINELKRFFFSIDKVVPMILIEVMIVDINRSAKISTGLMIGQSSTSTTGGTLNGGTNGGGGLNATLNSTTLNGIVNAINNLGYFNLGNVGQNFYVNMRALEDNGHVHIVSTPKLAALNGHEAEMSIGETTYYQENQTNVVGTQNPQTIQTVKFVAINADLAITIRPVVSGDDQITLEITVSQSDFTNKTGTSPPDYQKREFKSMIRMKNMEMVVLGGLENSRKSDSNTGVPWFNRVPVIKWFFGNESKENSKSELTIFIRPTVIQ